MMKRTHAAILAALTLVTGCIQEVQGPELKPGQRPLGVWELTTYYEVQHAYNLTIPEGERVDLPPPDTVEVNRDPDWGRAYNGMWYIDHHGAHIIIAQCVLNTVREQGVYIHESMHHILYHATGDPDSTHTAPEWRIVDAMIAAHREDYFR